jgi:hypothetical protein
LIVAGNVRAENLESNGRSQDLTLEPGTVPFDGWRGTGTSHAAFHAL